MASPNGNATDSSQESAPHIEFSKEETIAAVKDFFDFVTKMYVDEGAFESPPEGGWPNITSESMKDFGKTDEVVELLRHLPYPSADYSDDRPELMPAMPFAAFQHDIGLVENHGLHIMTEGMMYKHVPPHIVGLTKRPINDHGVLLDTKEGVVWWHEAAYEFVEMSPFPTIRLPDSDEDMTPGERHWRPGCDTVWTIPDFFATLKHNFKELHFVPMSRRRVVDGWYGIDEDAPEHDFQRAVEMVKGIYREHGWPDLERYRKKDCLKAIHIALRDNFPGEEDEEAEELLENDA